MFRFDLSLFSAPACKLDQEAYLQNAIEDTVVKTTRRKSTSKIMAPSPARTAKTQMSSTCSANNNASFNSIEVDFLRMGSTRSKTSGLAASSNASLEIFKPPPLASTRRSMPPVIHRIPSEESFEKKSSFSDLGRRTSLVGKSVLKNLRKNMSLVTAMSFDSNNSPKISRMKKKIRRRRHKSLPMMPRDVNVRVLEAGVEITTKPSASFDSCKYSVDSIGDASECGKQYDISIPKIIRESSTFATRSLTSGEETENADICKEDEDTRRLCELMDRIRSTNIHENKTWESSFDYSSPSNTFSDSEGSGEEIEVDEEDFKNTSKASQCESPTPDIFDMMLFVNNEHRVLEFAPGELQQFDSN